MDADNDLIFRRKLAKVIAPLVAFFFLLSFMVGPVLIFRILAEIPLSAKGPGWEVWLIVLGGGLGAGAARLSHYLILRNFGKFDEGEIERNWDRRKR